MVRGFFRQSGLEEKIDYRLGHALDLLSESTDRFDFVFIGAGIMGLIATLILLGLKDEIKGVFDNGARINFKCIFEKEKVQKDE